MSLWETWAVTQTACGDEIILRKREGIFEIRFNGIELMSNINHHSEDQLALRSMRRTGFTPKRILIGGLGLGFTLRSVLDHLAIDGTVTVCEIIPEVVQWNKTVFGHLAGHPLDDPRTEVVVGCVLEHMDKMKGHYDLILLDTDNGPEYVIRPENADIYQARGIDTVVNALRDNGLAAFWSASAVPEFEEALSQYPWTWERDDICLVPGRADAMHHIYSCRLDKRQEQYRKAS
jgi:spermidine synthase